MGWRSVIITQHAKLTYSMNMMIVQTKDGINQIPVSDINLVLISTSQAVITSALMSELAKNQASVIFVDDTYEPISQTLPIYPNNRSRNKLIKQFKWEEKRKEILWTKIVKAKIQNQINVLKSYELDDQELENSINELEIGDASNREAVAARKYFMSLFGDNFTRRNSDVINAALNYGYAILLSSVNREIAVNGYLSYLGIHHRSEENEFNLASDLMEPFRPYVDYWVKAHEKIEDFTPDIKYGLVDLLNAEIVFNRRHILLENAVSLYVRDALKYLSKQKDELKIEMELSNEV